MGKSRTVYRCIECGSATPKWGGRCTVCSAWNTLVEDDDEVGPGTVAAPTGPSSPAQPIADVLADGVAPVATGIAELDRVLGGGLVAGSVTLLGGEPGIGKSTLLLQLLAGWPARTLYVSAEESAQQVRLRAERLGAVRPELWLLPETSLPRIIAAIDEVQPELVVIDSIQSIADPREKLRRIAALHLERMGADRDLAVVFQVELRSSTKFMEQFSETRVSEYLDLIRSVILEGQREGCFRQSLDANVASKVFFGALDEMVTNWVLSRKAYDLRSTADSVIDLYFNGVTAA